MTGLTPARFPHSDIPGSKLAYSSPRLFAVRHVLLRHLVLRHPPCALFSLHHFILLCAFSYTATLYVVRSKNLFKLYLYFNHYFYGGE